MTIDIKRITLVLLSVIVLALPTSIAMAQDDSGAGRPGDRSRDRGRDRIDLNLIEAISDAAGLEPREILPQIRDGATLAEIIEANGGSVDAVIAEATSTISAELAERVAAGDITQDRADALLERFDEMLADLINGELRDMRGVRNRFGDRFGEGRGPRERLEERRSRERERGAVMRLGRMVLEETSLTRQELREQIQAGNTMADILSSNGVDVDGFINEVTTQIEARVNAAVEAGRITAEVAEARIEQGRETLTNILNRTFGTASVEPIG
jgi:hypothetical protein